MREHAERLIRGIKDNRKNHRRRLAIVTALAVLTGGNVFWDLREIGTAMTDSALCGTEAHLHSAECYDESETLICGHAEHTHTAACFSDEHADVETQELWELTLPADTARTRQEQVALIAESQLGYTESSRNFILGEDGTQHGYSRYGEWYGNPYGDWNTMFTYFCMYYADVTAEEMPYGGNAEAWQVKLVESGLLHPPEEPPERGSVILLDDDADGKADRTGVVTGTEEMLTVIEGDAEEQVSAVQYMPDDEKIIGYVILPEPDIPEEGKETETDAGSEPEQEKPLIFYNAESPSGIQVCASAEEDTFPPDTVMTVSDISREEALQTAADTLEADAGELEAVAVDISFRDADGEEIEPADEKKVQVQITLPEALYLSGSEYDLLHVSDEGEVQRVVEAEISQNGAGFTAESFSMYVLIAGKAVEKSNVVMLNGDKGNNSQTNPYVIGIGETIEVWYDGTDYADCRSTVENNDPDHFLERFPNYCDWVSNFGWVKIEDNMQKAKFVGNVATGSSSYPRIKFLNRSGTEVDGLVVKVVDHPIFIMQYGKRVLLNDSTISASVGDTISLSVNGSHPELLAPVDGSDTSQGYKISDTLYRGKPNYDNGNTFVNFVCTKDGTQEITVNGKTITFNITNDKLYRVIGGNRYEVHNGDTLKVYGDQFTLNVYNYSSHLLNPDSSHQYADSYDFCNGFLHRNAPDDSDYGSISVDGVVIPTTNVRFNCLKTGTSDTFTVNGKTIRVEVSPVYMIMNGNRVPLDEALLDMNKYTDRRLYGFEGEKFTFSFDGENKNLITDIDGDYFDVAAVNVNGNTNVTITCKKHFDGEKTFKASGEEFKIKVEHPIYVKTNIMERDIDRVTEWVSSQSWMPKHNGYNPNSENYPYLLYDSDAMTLRVPKSELTDAKLEIGTPYYFEKDKNNNNVKHEVSTYSALTLNEGSLTPDGDNINAVLLAHNTTEHDLIVPVYLKDGATTVRTMYVKVAKQGDNLLDHADIEIADGGKYTVTKLKRESDGTVKKIVTEYKAYVSGVNSSTLYQSQDDSKPCQFYYTSGNDILQYDSSVTGYVSSQYWVDPSIPKGSTQYELTSKYNLQTGYWSNTKFYANDVDHVVFDVVLSLEPSNEKEYTKNGSDWDLISTKTVFTDNDAKDIQSVKFAMDHQDVLDAYNKCPNHTGLDFTVMAFSALVEFDLNKELTGGTVQADQFSFEIIQKQVDFVRHWGNDYNGIVTRSYLDGLKSQGLKFKGAYRIFYDNPTKWGDGIDKEALVKELSTMPDFSSLNLNDAGTLFGIAQNDNESNKERRNKLFRVMQQYLINPEELTENGDDYKVRQDGFYLLSFESDPIQTVTNDANGIVTFNALHFEKDGDYNYIIREKPENAANILYDRKEIDLQIRVSEEQKQLTANILSDISTFEFTNHMTYRLPDTGGAGTLPWYLGGTGMMTAAAVLLLRKKRREGS